MPFNCNPGVQNWCEYRYIENGLLVAYIQSNHLFGHGQIFRSR